MRTTWNFFTAGQLTFGPGCVNQLGDLVAERKIGRVFLITDQNLIAAGLEEQVRKPLEAAGITVEVFSEGEPEPSLTTAMKAVDAARAFKPEAILGLGGGSNMDLSKMTSIIYTHGGDPKSYFGFDNVPGPVVPLVCVPTTAGTGSEVSHASVLTDTENKMKVSSLSNHIRPTLAVVDPELTYRCPKQVTADSGIDALTHAVEAYTATDYHAMNLAPGEKCAYEGRAPLSDCVAEKAIELVGQHLVTAVNDGDNREARDGMALAATLAGIAFSNGGVALVHALEYPLGGALHCSHGGGNGLLLPFVMRFNMPTRKKTFKRIAAMLGEDVAGLSEDDAAEKAITAVDQLKKDIGVPERIRDLGGSEDQLAGFAKKAFAIQRLRWVNPRESTEQDLVDIYRSAF